ncbi:MAG TPA: hypothetical protein PLB02_03120 [Thermoanaerobaculia bacterium]|nr:hypothetical protein [Thermoanaerobaculia bacterium]HQR66363.1 hypothetical protein [Thermoanaerobaculia bacterium]
MKSCRAHLAFLSIVVLVLTVPAAGQQPAPLSDLKAPQPTVPEIFSIEGQFVRVAYNNEGFVVLGYRVANASVGEEWMLLDGGVTMRRGAKDVTLTRNSFSVKTPDGKTIPLATQKEYADALYLQPLNRMARTMRDSINYFPVDAVRPCPIQFFADGGAGSPLSFDQFDATWERACVGRLFFKIPAKIQTGQHWLVVKFATSEVQVPFRILTKDEEKVARKKWEDFKKALDAQMGQ